ncbi:MAG: hypothetical protein LBS64_03015 [Spirochaetaceae bacterium]|jgi:hypothetical protein|nr:hypothetical protein [Spirochaetaceae bacterium]
MEEKVRVARLVEVFNELSNEDKNLVLQISETITQGQGSILAGLSSAANNSRNEIAKQNFFV